MGRRSTITQRDLECMLCDGTAEPKALPLSLLEEITDGFSDEQEIGRGGFAVVYKGVLENRTVAVKRMSNMHLYEKEFRQEVECLMIVKHKNIVRFLGYCFDTQGSMQMCDGRLVIADLQERLLCFEYVPRGVLHEYIIDKSRQLQWRERYKIITGICQGLHYIHQKNIVHLDLKPRNILLDDNLEAKIADFGLSRCYDKNHSLGISEKAGMLGYMAPELFQQAEITYQQSYKLDICSLGVIVLEILTGKKELNEKRDIAGNIALDMVVKSCMLEEPHSDVQMEQVRQCAEIGIECIASEPAKRPDIEHIISRFNERETMDEYIPIGMITSHQAGNSSNELHQGTPGTPAETSSEISYNPNIPVTIDKF